MTALEKQKIKDFLTDRFNLLVNKEKEMSGIRESEQFELARIDSVLKFIIEITNKIEKGDFDVCT